MNLTNAQHLAIKTRHKNMLVSASAGSGKTFVLVNRIVDLIEASEMSIDSCLIVTFTNAAAAEMRERIGQALLKRGSDQLKKLHFATISTLHAFCKQVLAEHYYTIDLNPNFRIGSQQLIGILLDEAVDEALASGYAALDADFEAMMAHFSSHRGDDALKQYIKKIYYLAMSSADPAAWLNDCTALYDLAAEQLPYGDQITTYLIGQLTAYRQQLERALTICQAANGPVDYAATLQADIAQFNFIEDLKGAAFERLYRVVQGVQFGRLASIKKANKAAVDPMLQARVKGLRDAVKKQFKNIQTRYFARPFSTLIAEQRDMQPAIGRLVELVKQTAVIFQRNKQRENVLDFNDLEQYSLAILRNPAVAQYYQSKYSHIFIDEYQDSNRVQEAIVNFVKRDDNLFLVGDVKQSIYRFRRAEPRLFMEKFKLYPTQPNACCIDLNANFRTHPAILKGINSVFCDLMSETFGGLNYRIDGQLTTLRSDFKGPATPRIILADADTLAPDGSKTDLALTLLSERVETLTNSEFSAPSGSSEDGQTIYCRRNFGYGDIVILLRSVKNVGAAIRDYFATRGIPVIVDEEDSYFDLIEVATLINFLKVIDNPLQDIALLSVLRSFFGGFDDRALAEIALCSDDYFFIALEIYQKNGADAALREQIGQFFALFNDLRANRFLPVGEFIWLLLEKTAYRQFVLGLENGSKRVKQIDVLLEKADQFESENQTGLHHFVDYLDQLKRSKINYGGRSNPDDVVDAVRIMSIHKSKGLEFPAVIVANIDKRFNMRDAQEKLVLHADLGIVAKWHDAAQHLQRSTIIYNYLADLMKRETLEEEQRLLYVAMTRAIYHLELIGVGSRIDKKIVEWQMAETPFDLARQHSYLDWLMATLLPADVDAPTQYPLAIECPHFRIDIVAADQLQCLKPSSKVVADAPNQLTIQRIDQPFSGYCESLPARLSVSALKRQASGYQPAKQSLNDSFGEADIGASVGSLYHKIMEQLSFQGDDVAAIVADLAARLNQPIKGRVNLSRIERFIGSPLYRRIQAADKIFKEQPFVYRYQLQKGRWTTLQGVVDLLFIEADRAVIVDYKSDRVADVAELKARYWRQLELYGEAVQDILGIVVSEHILYSIYLGEAISWH